MPIGNAFKTDEIIVLERLQVKYDQLIASFRI